MGDIFTFGPTQASRQGMNLIRLHWGTRPFAEWRWAAITLSPLGLTVSCEVSHSIAPSRLQSPAHLGWGPVLWCRTIPGQRSPLYRCEATTHQLMILKLSRCSSYHRPRSPQEALTYPKIRFSLLRTAMHSSVYFCAPETAGASISW